MPQNAAGIRTHPIVSVPAMTRPYSILLSSKRDTNDFKHPVKISACAEFEKRQDS